MTSPAYKAGSIPLRRIIPPDLSRLSEVREWLGTVARTTSLDESRVFDLQVVTSEAVANAIEHAASQVEVEVSIMSDRLVVEITNDGVFQPGLYKDDSGRRRGLGLPLMVSLADHVHVARMVDGRTLVTLSFLLEAGREAPAEAAPPRSTEEYRQWVVALAWLPAGLVVMVAAVLFGLGVSATYDMPTIAAVLDVLFIAAACFEVMLISARSYFMGGAPSVLVFGCAALVLGLGASIGGTLAGDPNMAMSIRDVALGVSGLLFVLSAVWSLVQGESSSSAKHRAPAIMGAYGLVMLFMAVGSWLVVSGRLPVSYAPGEGLTTLHHVILGVATVAFLTAGGLFGYLYRRSPSRFLFWCWLGLVTMGASLACLLLIPAGPGEVIRWVARCGAWISGLYLLTAILSLAGRPVAFIERSLRRAEDRYRVLVDLSPDPILVSAEGQVVFANPAAVRFFGALSSAELLGRPFLDLISSERHEHALERMGLEYAGSINPPTQSVFVRQDGTTVQADVMGSRIDFEGRNALQIIIRPPVEPRPSASYEMVHGRDRRESYLDAIFKGSLTPLVLLNRDFEFVRVNEAYAQACGGETSDFLGRNMFELFPTDNRTIFEEARRTKSPLKVKARLCECEGRPKGSLTYWDWSLTPLFDEAGEVETLLLALQDVTSTVRSKKHLWGRLVARAGGQLLERRGWRWLPPLAAVFQVVVFAGASRFDSPVDYLGLPEGVAVLLGVAVAIVAGPMAGGLVTFVGWLAYTAFLADFGATVSWATILPCAVIWIGGTVGVGMAADWVRQRARAREEELSQALRHRDVLMESLKKSEDKYRTIIETAEEGIVITTPNGAVTFANQRMADILGYSVTEIEGRLIEDFVTDAHDGLQELDVLNAVHKGNRVQGEVRFVRKDGTELWSAYNAVPMFDPQGEHVANFVMHMDVTDRKHDEARLESDKKLFSGVAGILEEALSDRTELDLGEVCLEVAEEITDSQIGFIGEIGKDHLFHDIAISNPGWDACRPLKVHGRRMPGQFPISGLYGWVLTEGRSLIVNDPDRHPASIGAPEGHPPLDCFLGVPLRRGSKTIGMIAVANREGGYTSEQQEMLEALAPIVVEALDRKRAEESLRTSELRHRALAKVNERLYRQQLDIAEKLQLALLNIPSEIGRVKLGHLYRSATEAARVGGDFYDVFEVKDGHVAVLIGDVSGHGIEAARTATLVKDVVHAFVHQSVRTQEVVRRTNKLLIEKELPGFVTLFLGILDADTGSLTYTSAGHPNTILRRANGEIELLGTGSSPLGVFPDAWWRPQEVDIDTGDLLLLYTDGVIEARHNGEMFGSERLEKIVKRKYGPVDRLPGRILKQVKSFSGGSLRDDVAILALFLGEHPPGSPARRSYRQQKLLE